MTTLNRFAVLGIVLLIPGCATAMRGTSQIVVISSEPSGGLVSIDGAAMDTTPALVSLKRKTSHTIGVVIDGYAAETRTVSSDAEYKWVALNFFLGYLAPAGIGVDLSTGAHKSLSSQVVNVRLAIRDSIVARRTPNLPWQPVPIGSRIRVTPGDPSTAALVGTLVAVAGDTLLLESVSSPVSHRISRRSVGTIELSLGPDRTGGLLRWMGKGALVGFAAGAAVGAITHGGGGAYYFGLLFGLPGGLVLGTIAGGVVTPNDKWLPIR